MLSKLWDNGKVFLLLVEVTKFSKLFIMGGIGVVLLLGSDRLPLASQGLQRTHLFLVQSRSFEFLAFLDLLAKLPDFTYFLFVGRVGAREVPARGAVRDVLTKLLGIKGAIFFGCE